MRKLIYIIFILSLGCQKPEVKGCLMQYACNYNVDATFNEGCIYPSGCNDWCDGDESISLEYDCAGECGGEAIEDCAGECGGVAEIDNCNECVDGTTGLNACIQDCSGDWGGSILVDCAGECGGESLEDECGTCDDDTSNNCVQDECGIWGGSGIAEGKCDCDGNELDCNGQCQDGSQAMYSSLDDFSNCCDSDEIGTYYQDLDGDGLGLGSPINICQNQLVEGFVTNSLDNDDSNNSNFDLSGYFSTSFSPYTAYTNVGVMHYLVSKLINSLPFGVTVDKIEIFNNGMLSVESSDSSVLNGNYIDGNSQIAVSITSSWSGNWSGYSARWTCTYNGVEFIVIGYI